MKINVPISPIIIKCYLYGYGEEYEEIEYNNYITVIGDYILKFEDLSSNNEYKLKCKFSPTNFLKNEIEIVVGDFENSDVNIPLMPSRTPNHIPQCIEFNFNSMENIEKFSFYAQKLCQKIMNENVNILSRIMGIYKCEIANISEKEDVLIKNKSIICLGESPNYKYKKYRENYAIENDYYEKHVNKFVDLLDTSDKIKNMFKEEELNLQLIDVKRYYDSNPPDKNKIKLIINNKNEDKDVNENIFKKKNDFSFNIISLNEKPIECFYNKILKPTDKKKYMKLYYKENEGIILYPNEQKLIDIKISTVEDKKMYSLYMNCYNLPGASIRYEKTGVYNAYTYLYTDLDDEQNVLEEQKVTINCAEKNNKINPHCLKRRYYSLLKIIKSKIPLNDNDIESEVEKFNKLSNKAQLKLLENLTEEFNKEIESIKINKRNLLQKIYFMAKYLTNRDCSIYSKGTTNQKSETIESDTYKTCRENKKLIYKILMNIVKEEFKCSDFKKLISKEGLSTNVEENIKNIIVLLQELSNNADSINKGESDILYDMTICLQKNFDEYWNEVEKYLKEKGSLNISITNIKKDLVNLLTYSLSNLVKVLHFEEIDNYINEKDRNITKTGIMAHEKGKKIHKSIKEFMKYFNEFGSGEYNLTDSVMVNVFTNKNKKNEITENIINYSDKGIIVILNPENTIKTKNAYSMQVITYDSPIMPIVINDNKKDSTIDTFISITLYDNFGNEIKTENLPENIRPIILYNKVFHKNLKYCFYYDEKKEDLDKDGVISEDNYNYKGNLYFKCSTEHLTSFTVGDYNSKTISTVGIIFIIIGAIVLLGILVIGYIYIRKKMRKNNIENNVKDKDLGALISSD